jgi:peptidoglycan/xylan/chitin deacetylase (PgdA/CDA1 family)
LTGPGTILLMHVGAQSQDGPALQTVIRSLQRRGFKFVTVAQLLRAH